jgi:transcriptional regulator with XRE-family HTH domain
MVRYRVNAPLIKKLREGKGKSQLQMCIDCDLQPAVISKIENGLTITPKADTLKKIASYFHMSMDDFMIMEN